MSFSVRLMDFVKDRESVISLLQRNRNLPEEYPYEQRYDWLYLNNPHGQATGWLVLNDDNGSVVGFTVALPREMSVFGKRVIAWNCADFSIDSHYRTLGIAAKLRRAAKEAIDQGENQFLYAHPNERMLVIHKRVGHLVLGKMQRYAKLINIVGKFKTISHSSTILKLIPPTANQILDYIDRIRSTKNKYDIQMYHHMTFSNEFTEFFSEHEKKFNIWGVRDSTYLNWRYHSNPIYRSHTVIARKNGKMVAYLIYTLDKRMALIKDLVASKPDALSGIICELSRELRKRPRCESISFIAADWNPYIDTLKRLGFHRRPTMSAIVVHSSPNFKLKNEVYNPRSWFMTVGDRDE